MRQLRTDIADAREQLTDLRRQRQRLQEEFELKKSELAATEARRQNALREIEQLAQSKSDLEIELERVKDERQSYFQTLSADYITDFYEQIKKSIDSLTNRVRMIQDYPSIIQWIKNKNESEPDPSQGRTTAYWNQWKSWYEHWRQETPDSWAEYLLNESMRRWVRGDQNEGRARTESEIVRDFMLQYENRPPQLLVTGEGVIREHIHTPKLSLLLEADQKLLLEATETFLRRNSRLLSLPLEASLRNDWDVENLNRATVPVTYALQQMSTLLPSLRSDLNNVAGLDDAKGTP